MSLTIKIPNLLKLALPLRHFKNNSLRAGQESRSWINSYAINNCTTFDTNQIDSLSAFMYPFVNEKKFRMACDLNNWFFFYDDVAETSKDAEKIALEILDAINDLNKNQDSVFGKVTKDFLQRTQKVSSPKNFERFKEYLIEYVLEVSKESKWRRENSILSFEKCLESRNILIGYKPSFVFAAILDEIEIKDEIYHSDIHRTFFKAACEIGLLLNDLASYPKDDLEDSNMNLVNLLMNDRKLNLQQSIDEVAKMVKDRVELFLFLRKFLKNTFCHVQWDIEKYTELVEFCSVGTSAWYHESNRYMSKDVCEKFEKKFKKDKNILGDFKIIFER